MDYNALNRPDLLCFSHLRWDFVYQRPQHLMSRFARQQRVYYIEEPVRGSDNQVSLQTRTCPKTGVRVVSPHLAALAAPGELSSVADLLADYLARENVSNPIAWFYTPMALEHFPESLSPSLIVYDCMDELSLFRNAPPLLRDREDDLLRVADLVFAGGVSLFEYKRVRHPRVHAFPSGVDIQHFGQARRLGTDPEDQIQIAHPRIGYAGVIDERIDLELIRGASELRPDWQFVMIGPVAKIDPETLPRNRNIHWLGMKDYQLLPSYFAGWDVAIMPFALNESTRFISPTKTPEYLAAGLSVISTPIRDVVRPYGDLGLVRIARDAAELVTAAEQSMQFGMALKWRERIDRYLSSLSWDSVWGRMDGLIQATLENRRGAVPDAAASAVEVENV